MARIQIPEKLEPLLKPKRFKVAMGGRGGGKSESFANILALKAHTEGANIGCFREFQNSIEDSVYSLLVSCIEKHQFSGFDIQASTIKHRDGGGMAFKGLARNPHSVKSMHGFNYFWIEEAQTLSQRSLDLLTPTLRESGSELWLSLNPQSCADPVSKRFIVPFLKQLERDGIYEDELHTIVVINWRDNPWFPDVLNKDRLRDHQALPRAKYDHIWEGQFDDEVDNALIPAEWFDAAIDAHKTLGFEPKGIKVVAHDPSDLGPDPKGLAVRHGCVFTQVAERDNGDANEGLNWATDIAITEQADAFVWDGDGLGVSLRKQVADNLDGKRIEFEMFKGSAGPQNPSAIYEPVEGETGRPASNKQTFKNRRAQFYWAMRDRFYATFTAVNGEYIDPDKLISISSDIEDLQGLRAEVCRIPVAANGSGLIQIESKEKMQKLGIPSPNRADAMMMSLAYTKPKVHQTITRYAPDIY